MSQPADLTCLIDGSVILPQHKHRIGILLVTGQQRQGGSMPVGQAGCAPGGIDPDGDHLCRLIGCYPGQQPMNHLFQ